MCFLVALARRSGRGIWDTMMYFLVIRSRGRVPITDSFVAKRIAGPGLAAHYFFQVYIYCGISTVLSSSENSAKHI